MFNYSSFSVIQILITLCPITTMFFCEMLVQLAIRIYTNNDIRADFIRYLLTVGGLYRNALSDKWEKLSNRRRQDFLNEKELDSNSSTKQSQQNLHVRSSNNTIKNSDKTKYKMVIYGLLTLLTVIITVLPGIASWLVSRTSTQELFVSEQSLNLAKRSDFESSLNAQPELRQLLSNFNYTETRNSSMNYADFESIHNLNILNLMNTTQSSNVNFTNLSFNGKMVPYTLDYASMATSNLDSSNDPMFPGLDATQLELGSVAQVKRSDHKNSFIKNNFKPLPKVVNRNVYLKKNSSFADTSLFYYEEERTGTKCFIKISDAYIISSIPFGTQFNKIHNDGSKTKYDYFGNELESFINSTEPYPNVEPVVFLLEISGQEFKENQFQILYDYLRKILDKSERFFPKIFRVYPNFTQGYDVFSINNPSPDNENYTSTFYMRKVVGLQTAEARCNQRLIAEQNREPLSQGKMYKRSGWATIIENSILVLYKDREMGFEDAINSSLLSSSSESLNDDNSYGTCDSQSASNDNVTIIYHAKFLTIWVIATSTISILLFLILSIIPIKVSGGDMMREVVSYKRCDTDLATLITEPKLPSAKFVVGTTYNDNTDMNHIGLVEKDFDNTQKPGKDWYDSSLL